jgi:hypothetical protein
MFESLQTSGPVAKHFLEPFERANVAFGGGRIFDAEHLGGLGAGQLLEMTQGEDFAVDGVEGVERFLEPEHAFGPDRRLSRRGMLAEELCRQRRRAGRWQGLAVERNLPAGVAHTEASIRA